MSTFAPLTVFMLVLLSACSILTPFLDNAASQDAQASPDASPLMTLHVTQGACREACSAWFTVYYNGDAILEHGSGERNQFAIEPEELDALISVVNVPEFPVFLPRAFAELFPEYYDVCYLYTFYRSDGSSEFVDSCKDNIEPDEPLIQTARALYSSYAADYPVVLLTINSHGGLCTYGECTSNITIYTDGTLRYQDGLRQAEVTLNSREIADLATTIYETDYHMLRSVPFTEMCPTAYDGQEMIFTFHVREAEEVVSSCEYTIDPNAPVFRLVNEVLTNHSDVFSG